MRYRITRPFLEAADFAGNALHDAMNQGEWFVFTERDEVNFVVGENILTVRIDQHRAVVRNQDVPGLRIGGRRHLAPLNGAGKKGMPEAGGDGGGDLRGLGVLE